MQTQSKLIKWPEGQTERSGKAGVAQLVERNLAKVEVASSSLVSRSKFKGKLSGFPFCQDGPNADPQALLGLRGKAG